MTDTLEAPTVDLTLHRFRSFATQIEQREEGILTAQFVPWDQTADVADPLPDGKLDVYVEGFRRGAFDGQVNNDNPGRIRMIRFRNRHGGDDLGWAIALRNTDGGLEGDIQVLPSRREDVKALLAGGVDGLSAEFTVARGGEHRTGGVRWRTRATIYGIALEPMNAYSGSRVLSLRGVDEAALEAEQERLEQERERADYEAMVARIEEREAAQRAETARLLGR